MGRDVLWRHLSVAQDGNRGKNRDYDDGDCKEFRHDGLALTVIQPVFISLLQEALAALGVEDITINALRN